MGRRSSARRGRQDHASAQAAAAAPESHIADAETDDCDVHAWWKEEVLGPAFDRAMMAAVSEATSPEPEPSGQLLDARSTRAPPQVLASAPLPRGHGGFGHGPQAYRVLGDFERARDGDLELRKGELVMVHAQPEDGCECSPASQPAQHPVFDHHVCAPPANHASADMGCAPMV